MVFVIPPVLIAAAWWRGCRPHERPLVIGLACVTGMAFVPALLWSLSTTSVTVHGIAFALITMWASSLARLLNPRPEADGGDDGGGEGPDEPEAPEPPDFDWDGFERDFWREVERRRRVPVA